MPVNWKISGSIPGSFRQHVMVFLGKMLYIFLFIYSDSVMEFIEVTPHERKKYYLFVISKWLEVFPLLNRKPGHWSVSYYLRGEAFQLSSAPHRVLLL